MALEDELQLTDTGTEMTKWLQTHHCRGSCDVPAVAFHINGNLTRRVTPGKLIKGDRQPAAQRQVREIDCDAAALTLDK